jgi:hypothetical protein
MGYGYAETFLIVFLTHPGVIVAGKWYEGVPVVLSGAIQMFSTWLLSLPGEQRGGIGATMYTIYLVFLAVYSYFFLSDRIRSGV